MTAFSGMAALSWLSGGWLLAISWLRSCKSSNRRILKLSNPQINKSFQRLSFHRVVARVMFLVATKWSKGVALCWHRVESPAKRIHVANATES